VSTKRRDRKGALADQRLVARCLAGEVEAWEDLYAQCHPWLCASIRVRLGRLQADPNLIDEIAARVWYSLVANDGELLARYTPARGGRLVTFLRALAKDEIGRHFRTERRRFERELATLRERPARRAANFGEPMSAMAEFLATLTPHERGFCGDYLLATPSETALAAESAHSPSNIWQLTRRIYKKLLEFLDDRS
jgi:DNA-directed RNA polymerase specialized sigma24 family protein